MITPETEDASEVLCVAQPGDSRGTPASSGHRPAARRLNRHRFRTGRKGMAGMSVLALIVALVAVACGGGNNGSPSQPLSGLWVANLADALEFLNTSIEASGNATPALVVNLPAPGFGAPQGVTFDPGGNLWVLDGGTVATGGKIPPTVDEYTLSQLSTETTSGLAPTAAIGSANFGFPQQLVFDSSGNLWVSDAANNEVFEFTTSQLTGGANVTPALILTSSPSFNGSLGIAFDSSGNLWIANNHLSGAAATIFEFSAKQLAGLSGAETLAPAAVLQSNGSSLSLPWALAFDSNGNLWVSNQDSTINTVVQFSQAQLAALTPVPTAPTPAVTITATGSGASMSIDAPTGLAIDLKNNLAVANANNSVAYFSAEQLTASGSPAPAIFVAGSNTTIDTPEGLAFGGGIVP